MDERKDSYLMAYDSTEVPVTRSQEGIRKLIMSRQGAKIAFISDPPREGFQAEVQIDGLPYQVRIMGECRPAPATKERHNYRRGVVGEKETTDKFRETWRQKEERRIWRVLYYHLKSVFEAADSGVMEFRELMLPYLITKSGQTVAEHLVPQLAAVIGGNAMRLLPGKE
jgi:hypothetical protein